jgi:hypothetical protein
MAEYRAPKPNVSDDNSLFQGLGPDVDAGECHMTAELSPPIGVDVTAIKLVCEVQNDKGKYDEVPDREIEVSGDEPIAHGSIVPFKVTGLGQKRYRFATKIKVEGSWTGSGSKTAVDYRKKDCDAPALKRQRTAQPNNQAAPANNNNNLEQLASMAQDHLSQEGILRFERASRNQIEEITKEQARRKDQIRGCTDEINELNKELKPLIKTVAGLEKKIGDATATKKKLAEAKNAAELDLATLNRRKCKGRPNDSEPLDGIYVDLVGQFNLDKKIRDVFDAKKKKSPIYVGTAEGPGVNAAKGRKESHDKTYGIRGNNNSAIMRLIHVTDYAHAGEAEQYCIRQLRTYAKEKKQVKDVRNRSGGGEGIHRGPPYHLIYIYYTPQEKSNYYK